MAANDLQKRLGEEHLNFIRKEFIPEFTAAVLEAYEEIADEIDGDIMFLETVSHHGMPALKMPDYWFSYGDIHSLMDIIHLSMQWNCHENNPGFFPRPGEWEEEHEEDFTEDHMTHYDAFIQGISEDMIAILDHHRYSYISNVDYWDDQRITFDQINSPVKGVW